MNVEALCPPQGEFPNRLKAATEIFGSRYEAVRAPSLDQQIARGQIGTVLIKNPQVVALATLPDAVKPGPALKTSESITVPKTEPLSKQGEYVEGPIFAFGVGSYRKLYNRYLETSDGNTEFAKKYTRMAIIKDGTSLIQEYFADAKDKTGQYIISDHVMRAQLTHTPTKNEYLIKDDQKTGKKIICSPEQEPSGSSITEFVSGFRRGADLAMIDLVQELATSLPAGGENETTHELLWASPRSASWESHWVRKYCSKFGYIYKGSKRNEGGVEKLVVYSYKVDLNAASAISFMQDLDGQSYQASFEGLKDEEKDEKGQPREVDVALRTLTLLDRPMQDQEVILMAYGAKGKIERSSLMFDLDEATMQYTNNPFLRDLVEAEVSTPVADWLVEKIASNIPEEDIQLDVEGKYIDSLKSFVKKTEGKKEHTTRVVISSSSGPSVHFAESPVSPQEMMFAENLRRRQEVGGGFCGDLGGESSSLFGGSSIIESFGVMNFTSRSGGFTRGGGLRISSGEVTNCKNCGDHLCGQSRCNKCKIDY